MHGPTHHHRHSQPCARDRRHARTSRGNKGALYIPYKARNGMRVTANIERFPILGSFAISRGAKTEAAVVVAAVEDGGFRGRGECVPYARYGESLNGTLAQ